MEAFQLLSRGGVRFDKKRFKNEFNLFDVRSFILHNSTLSDHTRRRTGSLGSEAGAYPTLFKFLPSSTFSNTLVIANEKPDLRALLLLRIPTRRQMAIMLRNGRKGRR